MIVVTHEMAFAKEAADRVYFIEEGDIRRSRTVGPRDRRPAGPADADASWRASSTWSDPATPPRPRLSPPPPARRYPDRRRRSRSLGADRPSPSPTRMRSSLTRSTDVPALGRVRLPAPPDGGPRRDRRRSGGPAIRVPRLGQAQLRWLARSPLRVGAGRRPAGRAVRGRQEQPGGALHQHAAGRRRDVRTVPGRDRGHHGDRARRSERDGDRGLRGDRRPSLRQHEGGRGVRRDQPRRDRRGIGAALSRPAGEADATRRLHRPASSDTRPSRSTPPGRRRRTWRAPSS